MIVSLVSFFAFAPSIALAQVIITEIMFDVEGTDTDREWIEVQNAGSEPVDLTQWKFFESNSNHGLVAHQGGEMLAPGAYAIIVDSPAKFLADWPSFSGHVFDSSFALNNTGETLVLRCCGKELSDRDSVTYNSTGGGNGDGLSLHRSGSTLLAAQPSPGSGAVAAAPPRAEPPPPPPAPKAEPPPVQQVVQKTEVIQTEEKKQDSPPSAQSAQPVVAHTAPPTEPTFVVQAELPEVPNKKKTKAPEVVEDTFVEEVIAEERVSVETKIPVTQFASAGNAAPPSDWLWWLGAAAISIFGAGGAYVAGRAQRPQTIRTKDGWQIEEIE